MEREGTEWFCRHGNPTGAADEIILDIDSTCDPTHGAQQLTVFNGHYHTYMYHPLLIFEGNSGVLLGSCLRPGDVGGTRQLLPLLRPMVRRLRSRFPRRTIAIRGDGDFAKPALLDYADYADCSYAIAALETLLNRNGQEFKAFVGMRHWHPYIKDTVAEMQAQGIKRAVGLVMAPHYSRMSIEAYFNKIKQAESPIELAPIYEWHLLPGYLDALVSRVCAALERFPADERPQVPIIFSAHSLPERIGMERSLSKPAARQHAGGHAAPGGPAIRLRLPVRRDLQ